MFTGSDNDCLTSFHEIFNQSDYLDKINLTKINLPLIGKKFKVHIDIQ